MKYLIFLPITLLSFGVAFGGSDYVDMATDGSDGGTSASRDVTVTPWVEPDGMPMVGGTSDKDDQSRTASKKSEIGLPTISVDSTSDGSNDIGTDYSCPSNSGCPM